MPEVRRRPRASSPSAPASSGWSRKRPSCFPARASWCCPAISSTSVERLRAGARRRRARPLRHRHRHAARRQGPSFPQAQSGRHRRCRSRPCATAIRAPPSARSSCCIRSSAAPAAKRAAAIGYLQTHQPEHPVMRALIAQRPRGVLREPRSRLREKTRLSAVRPAGEPVISARDKHAAEAYAPQARGGRADARAGARARPGRSAARGGARPPSLPRCW